MGLLMHELVHILRSLRANLPQICSSARFTNGKRFSDFLGVTNCLEVVLIWVHLLLQSFR